ncbi:MAG: MarR family transcriptional regulator [Syntrophomonadaceae bacterium]|nr:MarR family transcriptional regulator [Syntrophomonadaceae bacterium]
MEPFTDFLCFRVGALARRIARFYNHRYAEYGVTVGQSFVLFHLLEHDGSSPKDIAARLQLEPPAVTGTLDRLVKEGLVVRGEDPSDRRGLRIRLTPLGREKALRLRQVASEYNRQLREVVGKQDVDAFLAALVRLEREL